MDAQAFRLSSETYKPQTGHGFGIKDAEFFILASEPWMQFIDSL